MRTRKTRLVGVAVGLLVLVAVFGAMPGGASAEPGGPSEVAGLATVGAAPADDPIPEGDIAARARLEGVGPDEALRRLRDDRVAAKVEQEARAASPDTFAGVWIQHGATYAIHVAYTEAATDETRALKSAKPVREALVAETRSRSIASLEALQETLIAERGNVAAGRAAANTPQELARTNGRYDLDIDVEANDVIITLPSPSQQLSGQLADRHGSAVRVVDAPVAEPAACASQDYCVPAILGGLRINDGIGTSCSTAFVVTGGGPARVLTAGHCRQGSDGWTHGGVHYGGPIGHSLNGSVDAMTIQRDAWTTLQESSKFFVAGEWPRNVTGLTTYANTPIGAFLGKSGATTGTQHGFVTSRTVAPGYVPNARNFIQFDACAAPGDSGGAVFQGNNAAGIVSGRALTGGCRTSVPHIPEQGPAIYGAIDFAINALGVAVVGGLDVPPIPNFTHSCDLLGRCHFDGWSSFDPDGGIVAWNWTFSNGGGTASGPVVDKTFLPGNRTVTLYVYDNDYVVRSISKTITVL